MHASPFHLDNGIVPSDLIETNQARVNNIYYNTIGSGADEITTAQADSILEIAIQCPLLGGNAVYEARALYLHYDADYEYNDELTCLQAGIVMRKKQVLKDGISATVFPNPAKDLATIKYNIAEDGEVMVFNSLGNIITHISIEADQTEATLNLKDFTSGVYIFKLMSGNQVYYLRTTVIK
ncbi:MAG: Secretion system C-terminal sorting domain [Bacteroidota bacterium]|jgi:hypothetical protein